MKLIVIKKKFSFTYKIFASYNLNQKKLNTLFFIN